MQQITIELSGFFSICLLIISSCYLISAIMNLYCTIVTKKMNKRLDKLKSNRENKFDQYGLPMVAKEIPVSEVKNVRQKEYVNDHSSLLKGGGYSPRDEDER